MATMNSPAFGDGAVSHSITGPWCDSCPANECPDCVYTKYKQFKRDRAEQVAKEPVGPWFEKSITDSYGDSIGLRIARDSSVIGYVFSSSNDGQSLEICVLVEDLRRLADILDEAVEALDDLEGD